MRHRKWIGAILAVELVALAGSTVVAQESASFSMDRITVTVGGQSVGSSNYDSTIIAVQGSPSGAASFCNSGYVSSLGFFSVLGDLAVPIRLTLEKNAVDPSLVELSWTGSEDVFQVYRSVSPADLLDPLNLDRETSLCDGSDGPVVEDLVFYKIIAKATE